jgi:hypothetical protein
MSPLPLLLSSRAPVFFDRTAISTLAPPPQLVCFFMAILIFRDIDEVRFYAIPAMVVGARFP